MSPRGATLAPQRRRTPCPPAAAPPRAMGGPWRLGTAEIDGSTVPSGRAERSCRAVGATARHDRSA
eukprot:1289392-Pyramimonas_sp.AAC.1